jgi:hypothetical protein
MRRSWLRILVLAVAVAVVFAFPLLAPTAHRIDQAHFELIQDGMTRADVEAIFGVPPGKYDGAEAEAGSFAHLMRLAAAARMEEAQPLSKILNGQAPAELEIRLTHPKAMENTADAELRLLQLLAEASETWVGRHGGFIVQFDRENRVVSTNGRGRRVRVVLPWQRWWKAIRGE